MKNYIFPIIASIIVIIAAVFITVQFNPTYEETEDTQSDDTTTPVGNSTFADAVNSFAFDFFQILNSDNDGNIFISPYSIFTALAMTFEGAEGETADEMAEVLHIEQDNDTFHEYMKNLYEVLNEQNDNYNISTANSLWINENLQLLEEFINVITEYYGGEATNIDYSNPEEAAGIINQWVEDHTNGLIKDLISPIYIDPVLTALILVNAIYFKGVWEVQFDPDNTTDRPFENYLGETIDVPTMSLVDTENEFNYAENDDLQILELPYSGDDLSMLILLPKENDLSTVVDSLDDASFTELKESMAQTKLDIYLPKFKIETSYTLNDYLQELGMVQPFLLSADFSGMTGSKDLYISLVVHKAYIDVNEEGTEAAAATAVIMYRNASPDDSQDIVFDCDHPFLYIIQHKETGTILFMGSVTDFQ